MTNDTLRCSTTPERPCLSFTGFYTDVMKKISVTIILLLFWSLLPIAQAIEIRAAQGQQVLSVAILESATTDLHAAMESKQWRAVPLFRIPSHHSQLWLRVTTNNKQQAVSGLYISMLGSFQLYRASALLYQSGDPATPDKVEEGPGNIDNYILLPSAVPKAEVQTWYLRISREALPEKYRHATFDFTLNHYDALLTQRYEQSLLPLISLSVFFTITIYYFCLWVSQGYPTNLLFSLLCLVLATWLLVENWRPMFGYPYPLHGMRQALVSVCAALFAILLPATLLREFKLPWRQIYALVQVGLFISLHLAIPQFDLITGLFVLQGFVLSLLVAFLAMRQRHSASSALFVSLLICALAIIPAPNDYLEQWFFVLFPLVIVALLYRQSIGVKQLRESRKKALIHTENLKLQLLKKSIQPHFLLNTLTSLSEWIEQAPDKATQMVEQLAEEFYLLGTMTDKSTVTLEQEIALCTTHLALMSLRNNCEFQLQSNVPNPQRRIPPGILHTLFENAFSHNHYPQGCYTFFLEVSQIELQQTITLQSPLVPDRGASATGLGLGSQYIESRLQQQYPNQWTISEQQKDTQWHTQITLPA